MIPNPIIKGAVKFTSRKVDMGQFRLKPTLNKRTRKDEITQIVGYCVACAQEKFNIDIYAICVMSNHFHMLLRDNEANIPWFLAEVHRNIAQCVNKMQKKKGAFWNRDRAGQTWLPTVTDLFIKMLYVMLNPVAAGLVQFQKNWPGMVTKPEDFISEKGVLYKRPPYYFKSNGKMPKSARLVYSIPPGYDSMDRKSFAKYLAEKIKVKERHIYIKRKKKKVLGRRRILKMDPFSTPKNGTKEGGFNPAVACHDLELRIKCQAWLKNWRITYRQRWLEYKRGRRKIKFPYGTFKLAWEHPVRVVTNFSAEADQLTLVLPEFA
jgi:putative transposase